MTEKERLEEKEQLEAQVKALGKKSRTMRDITERVLNARISKEKARKLVSAEYLEAMENGLDNGENEPLTMLDLLTVRMAQAVFEDGSTKAMEYLRDTSGNKPTERKEVAVDIMTDNDRALIDKVSQRLTENG